MEFHVIELPKLPKELKENNTDVLLWAKFINAEREEEFQMLASKNTYIDSAYERLQVISQDKQKQLEYEARQKAILDYNQMVLEATEKGFERGEHEKAIEIAKNMILKNLPADIISEVTGLSLDELKVLNN